MMTKKYICIKGCSGWFEMGEEYSVVASTDRLTVGGNVVSPAWYRRYGKDFLRPKSDFTQEEIFLIRMTGRMP